MPQRSIRLAPRYTPGSPGTLFPDRSDRGHLTYCERLAASVSASERRGYETALSGVYGEDEKARAVSLGLSGIVVEIMSYARKWRYRDLIEGVSWEETHR